jgi:hypothetical protein
MSARRVYLIMCDVRDCQAEILTIPERVKDMSNGIPHHGWEFVPGGGDIIHTCPDHQGITA